MIFWVLRIDIGTYRTTWVYNYKYLYAHKKCLEDCFKLESQKISKYYHAPGTPPKKNIMELSGIWVTKPTCLIANKIIIASRRSGWPMLMGASTIKWKTYNP
jgi:hypothetical protein